MSTAVAIMDRDRWSARTDVIVVADRRKKSLTWILRDLWSKSIQNRINSAYKLGGHEVFIRSLNEFGLNVKHSLCALPKAVCRAFGNLAINVPVSEPTSFYYAMTRISTPTEENKIHITGRREVTFLPPLAMLSGERIHEWIGARRRVDGGSSNDFDRIKRQQILVKRLLETKFNFAQNFCEDYVSFSNNFSFEDLRHLDASWKIRLFGEGRLGDQIIRGRAVIVLGSRLRGLLSFMWGQYIKSRLQKPI